MVEQGFRTGRTTVQWPCGFIGKHRTKVWLCLCDCGTLHIARHDDIRSGCTTSCGCRKREVDKERGRQLGLKNIGRSNAHKKRPYEVLYNKLLNGAKKRGHKVELTYEQYLEFVEKDCHYCDAKLSWVKHNTHKAALAHYIDRKDNTLGYSKDNCVACCPRCNWGKGDSFTYEEWVVMTAALKGMKKHVSMGR